MHQANSSKGGAIVNFTKNIPTFFDPKEETISEYSSKAENELLNSPGTKKRKNMSEHSPKAKKSKSSPNKNSEPINNSEPMDNSGSNIKNRPLSSPGTGKKKTMSEYSPKAKKNMNSPTKDSKPMDDSDPNIENGPPNSLGMRMRKTILKYISKAIKNMNSPIKNSQLTGNSEILNVSPPKTISSVTNHTKKKPKNFDLKIDSAFKFVYGHEGGSDITKCFVNGIFDPEEMKKHRYITDELYKGYSPVESIQFKNTALNLSQFNEKTGHVDTLFDDQDKSPYIMEMQNVHERDFLLRVMFYATLVWLCQLVSGGSYRSLKKISVIAITAFDVLPKHKHYLRYHPIMSIPTKTGGKSVVIGRLACINLAKFNVPIDQLKTPVERFIFSLKYPSGKNEYDENMVVGDYNIIRRVYDRRDKFYADFLLNNQYICEKQLINEKEDDRIAAKIRGEVDEKIKFAIKMIKNKSSITEISEMTELQEEFIIELTKMLKKKFHSKPISDIVKYYSEDKIEDMALIANMAIKV
jgi:predicted transposase/invertase (TIGR01784 family)